MKSRRIPTKIKTKNDRFTHPIGAFTPTSPMVTKGRKIPLAAEIRTAAARARAASQSSSSGSSGPSPNEFYNYRKEMKKNQMQFDMEPPAAAPAAPASPRLYSPVSLDSSRIRSSKNKKPSYRLRELSLSPLTTFNTNDRTGLNDDEKEYLKSIANNHSMDYPGKGISPVSELPVQNTSNKLPNFSIYYPFKNITEMSQYKFNIRRGKEQYKQALQIQAEVNAERERAAAAAAAGEISMFKIPTKEEFNAWDSDEDKTINGGKRRRRKTKRKKSKRRRKTKRKKSKRQRKTKRRRKSSFSKTKRRKK